MRIHIATDHAGGNQGIFHMIDPHFLMRTRIRAPKLFGALVDGKSPKTLEL